jgi:hypothetical protein
MRAPPTSLTAVRHELYYGQAQTPLVRVEPDSVYSGMWRMVWPDGRVSDMVNLARAKDAALVLAQRGPPAHDLVRLHWRISPLDSPSGACTRVLPAGPAHRAHRSNIPAIPVRMEHPNVERF